MVVLVGEIVICERVEITGIPETSVDQLYVYPALEEKTPSVTLSPTQIFPSGPVSASGNSLMVTSVVVELSQVLASEKS